MECDTQEDFTAERQPMMLQEVPSLNHQQHQHKPCKQQSNNKSKIKSKGGGCINNEGKNYDSVALDYINPSTNNRDRPSTHLCNCNFCGFEIGRLNSGANNDGSERYCNNAELSMDPTLNRLPPPSAGGCGIGTNNNDSYGLPKKRNNSGTVKWSNVFLKYAENTTFHGLKNVAENQVFLVRRLIWLMLFLGGMFIFMVQMVTSIQYYVSWPVTVDVKINYNDSIVFPAVTICNGNAFRTTETYKLGFYNMISNLYGIDNIRDFNLSGFAVEDMSLDKLYLTFGHNKLDLIVGCEWNEVPCSVEKDFVVTMTDYGMCYTFNSVSNGSQPRMAYQTGAEGGLRLQLNIEQYQYMRGPNEGAGLKIMVHNAHEIPLVRDHGLAVPPGHHGLIAIKTIEVNNLKPNHGKCDDNIKLEHFDSYTYSSCFVNCKEMYVIKQCACRDIYMPDKNTIADVCSISNYTKCMVGALADFREIQGNCTCPIPCKRSLYEPYVSYAATSNFDISALLRKSSTDQLRKNFIKARETTQRVSKAIAIEDTNLVTALRGTVKRLDKAFQEMNKSLDVAHRTLKKDFDSIQKRINYHLDRGLEGVQFIIEHDFIRGWDVFKERSFHYVTLDFMDFPQGLKRTIQNALELSTGDRNLTASRSDRFLLYSPVLNTLLGRDESAERARLFINETHNAYLTGDPLLTYKLTYARRYDMAFIHLPLLQTGKDQQSNYDETIEAIDRMNLGISVLKEVGNQFVETGFFNETHFLYGDDRFQSAGRQFNYRIYMFETRVVAKPLEVINERIEEFKILNRSLQAGHDNVELKILQISSLLRNSIGDIWQEILNISICACNYLNKTDFMKTPLSLRVTSKELEESIRSLAVFFTDVRSRVRELQDGIMNLKTLYKSVWASILTEDSTQEFYKMEYTDCQDFLTNETQYEYYLPIFRYMLRTNTSILRNTTKEEIVLQVNGDIYGMDIDILLDEIEQVFQNLSQILDLSDHIGDSDELFLVSFEKYRQSMATFLSGNEINSDFYRENFMRLDVFMQELSYEEITQQKAYEITQLLSDIGGSMGLFIGGSVLSIFEFLDVFIHYGARMVFNR